MTTPADAAAPAAPIVVAERPAPAVTRSAAAPPAAAARDNAAGRSKMATHAANLVANRTINTLHNGLNYPVHMHKLNAAIVLNMFHNIVYPLVLLNYRLLGVQTPTTPADVVILQNIAYSVSHDALTNVYLVLYNKASRIAAYYATTFGRTPSITTPDFPLYVTALINSIGPIQLDDVPAKGQHIPYLAWTEVEATYDVRRYAPNRVAMFAEALARSKQYAIAAVDPYSTQSSAWWTFHCYPERIRDKNTTFSLWSPVKFDAVDNALKLGVLYAKQRITTDIGIINFSTTPFYDVNDPPRYALFPDEVFQYPYFIESQPAYFRILERDPPAHHSPDSPTYQPISPSTNFRPTTQSALEGTASSRLQREVTPTEGTSGASTRGTSKKRRLPEGSATVTDADTVAHRVIYHYFDHQVMANITNRDLDSWTHQFNQI